MSANLVVKRLLRIREIKNNTRMRLRSTTVRKLLAKVNSPVEAEASILIEVNVQRLEVSRGVDQTNLASLYEVIGDHDMLLIWGHLDIVGSDSGLVFVGVIQTLDVVEVADVQCGDVVGCGESKVDEATVLGNVGAGVVSYADEDRR